MLRRLIPLVALAAGPALAAAPEKADWAAQPGEEVRDEYPPLALEMNMKGKVVLTCALSDRNVAQDCKVEMEAPAGLGFGQAAIRMSEGFRFRPGAAGKPDDREVRIPINFEPDSRPAPSKPNLPEASPDALDLARRFIELRGDRRAMTSSRLSALSRIKIPDPTNQVTLAAREAVVVASGETVVRISEDRARLYGASLSTPHLQQLNTYLSGPSEQRFAVNSMRRRDRAIYLSRDYYRQAARRTFCQSIGCIPLPEAPPEPLWVERPTAKQITARVPAPISIMGLAGGADLECRPDSAGMLKACRVLREGPEKVGFGEMALALSAYYRAPAGETRPLVFRVATPGLAEVSSTLPPPPSRALALARRGVELERLVDKIDRGGDAEIEAILKAPWPGAGPGVVEAARSALKTSQAQAIPKVVDTLAADNAAQFSEAELEAHVAYLESPAYQALADLELRMASTLEGILEYEAEVGRDRAKQLFCEEHTCPK